MRAISEAFRKRLETNTTLLAKATLTLADGTVRDLAGDDLVSLSCEQATTSSGSFDVGAAIIGSLSVTLNNHDERFATYDFDGSSVIAYVGADLGGETEWLRVGTYLIDQPDSFSGTIALDGLDYMAKLEGSYSKARTSYPATLGEIVSDACSACGVTLATRTFPNSGYSVSRRPDSEDITCLEVVAAAAQVAGCYAKVDENGALHIAWYDRDGFSGEDWLDGETFDGAAPYASGDDADGGTFDYDLGYVADGGSFDSSSGWAHIHSYTSLKVYTDDVTITGVQVTAEDEVIVNSDGSEENGNDGETVLSGTDGYVIRVEGNPLVCYGQAAVVARQIAGSVVGMTFRPFSASLVANPEIEAGDCVIVSDARGNSYRSFATTVALKANGPMTVSCDAKSKSAAAVVKKSEAQKAEDNARDDLHREEASRKDQYAKFEVTASEIRAEVADKASKSELSQTASQIQSTVREQVEEGVSEAKGYASTVVTQTARDLTVEINSAQSSAQSALSAANSAKSVTNRFSFSSSGLQITGLSGGTQRVATYTADGFRVDAETCTMGSSSGALTVKDWGMYFESSGGEQMWLTDGSRYGGGSHFRAGGGGWYLYAGAQGGFKAEGGQFRIWCGTSPDTGNNEFYVKGTGWSFGVSATGVYYNGNRIHEA